MWQMYQKYVLKENVMKKYKVGIIGAGRIGRVHGTSITYHIPNAEVKSVSDVRLDGVRNGQTPLE